MKYALSRDFYVTCSHSWYIQTQKINRIFFANEHFKNSKYSQSILEKKANKWKKTFGSAVYRRKVLKEEKMTKELYLYIIKRMRNEYKFKNNTLKLLTALEEIGQMPEDNINGIILGLRRADIMTEEEKEEYSDSKLPIIASKIS